MNYVKGPGGRSDRLAQVRALLAHGGRPLDGETDLKHRVAFPRAKRTGKNGTLLTSTTSTLLVMAA